MTTANLPIFETKVNCRWPLPSWLDGGDFVITLFYIFFIFFTLFLSTKNKDITNSASADQV